MATNYEPFAQSSMYIVRRWWGFQYVPNTKVVAYCHELRIAREALEKIADPRKRDHQEPDAYTQLGCVMNIADEALKDIERGTPTRVLKGKTHENQC